MAHFSQEIIDEIIDKTDILDLVSEYVKLDRKSSANHFGLCPFHAEKTPSFSVSTGKQIYYCFGCQKGGNVISFIQEIEGLTFPEAVQFLAKRLGITLAESNTREQQLREDNKKRQYQLMLAAAKYYYSNFTDAKARSYMYNRGFKDGILKRFGIGYANAKWDGLYQFLLKHKFNEQEIMASGLVRRGKNGRCFDLLRERVVFPIFNPFGELIAFGGRIINQGEPKYLNSPDTIIYNKGRQLFSLNFARKSKEDYFIIT
ncbi:MAG: DNA primase, partial [Vagococcus sp.]|nr:DNA primase [Vagococcus sp.]